ncbi:MAG TPA: Gfo/Idh/MocA family oxidoreductase [Candidatus Saccharimonadales bacterium]|nr:Gfo/Idh/MocA family oxidoreductase [Candidatus Saccharimonadales bacterium]
MNKILIVGLGRGTAWAREIRKDPSLEIVGLVDVDADRLASVAAEVNVPAACQYADYETALARSGANLVILAVPTPLHKPYILRGLTTGHHVICEKPLALSLDEARDLGATIRGFDHRFMVGEQYRFADGMENLRRAITGGVIGRVAYIDHTFVRGSRLMAGRWARGAHWSQAYQEASLQDMSVHHFDMWYYMTGARPVEVSVTPFDVDWNPSSRKFGYSMTASLENGIHVDYLTARALARPQTPWYGTLWIVGETGALAWDGDSPAVRLSRVVEGNDPFGQEVQTDSLAYVDRGISGTNLPLLLMIRELDEAIAANRRHACDLDDNLASFATSLAGVESARTGRPVRVALD